MVKNKRRKLQIVNIRNKKGAVTIDPININIRKYYE